MESGTPFDVQRAHFTVTGQYDQVGEFLSDIASLPRIVVPFDVRMERASGPGVDTTQHRAILRVGFQIRTFVKSAMASEGAAPAAPASAPRAGGDRE
jgi:Tfp pilus assembly protein PilO